jgi:hypothetical protein
MDRREAAAEHGGMHNPTPRRPRSHLSRRHVALLPLLFAWQVSSAQLAEAPPVPDPSDKSYAIPALEIVGFDLLLNQYNRHFSGSSDYDVTFGSIRRNLRGRWITDNDPFSINQFAHPYQGSLYHGAGRSAGLNYWEASALTFVGSAWWEITGEKTPPSYNDQIASGVAGSFLGEPLFRMAHLLLHGNNDVPQFWREWGAAGISPAVGFNRLMYGSRFDGAFSDHQPEYNARLRLGFSHVTRNEIGGNSGPLKRNEAVVDFAIDYGLPGKPGYTYQRPFDYFAFRVVTSSANHVDNLTTRGLLFGTDYEIGDDYRGIWGLYGSYDYVAPQIFHVSTTALSLGTTAQWWLSRDVALQGTALTGFGYSAASSARGVANDRDYHYGVAPRASLNLRLLAGTRAMAEVSGQKYYLGSIANRSAGRDDISRIESAFTWRIQGPHAVALRYTWSHRSASYPVIGDRSQTLGTIGIYYTLMSADGFGGSDWRDATAQR